MDRLEKLVYYHHRRLINRVIFEESNFGRSYYVPRLTRDMCNKVLQPNMMGEWACFDFILKTQKRKKKQTFSLILNEEYRYILYDDNFYSTPILRRLSIIDSSALIEPDPKYWFPVLRRLGLCNNAEAILKHTITRKEICINALDYLIESFEYYESDSASWSTQ